ncbi:MAG: endo alpha-1,4 polygalactosaminidase [Acidimicrobiia bacterium]|nr:endo alpha-1,4 polygalactosaminidase [Acidimicrobiia bacterium]
MNWTNSHRTDPPARRHRRRVLTALAATVLGAAVAVPAGAAVPSDALADAPVRETAPAAVYTPPAAAAASPVPTPGPGAKPAWGTAGSWGMQNSGYGPDGLAKVAASTKGLVVTGRFNGAGQEWTRAEVEAAKANKWMLSYIAVGEAQRSEWYWRPEWNANPPAWVVGQNPWWANNAYADEGNPEWQQLVLATIDRIIDQGFDGAFLDVVDIYWFPDYPGGPSRENMAKGAAIVCQIAQHARARVPGFKLLVNNAVNLSRDFPGYADCFDGTVIEALWWFNDTTPRDDFYRNQKIDELRYVQQLGKPVYALDYAQAWDRPRVAAEAAALGYVIAFSDFALETPLT